MRSITCEEMVKMVDMYSGKKVEISLTPSPIQSNNTYQHFRLRDIGDKLEFYDININKPTLQELIINKSDIKEIQYWGSNAYDSVFIIKLENGSVEFCISENPIRCSKCGNILEPDCEQVWFLDQLGGYFSKLDMERITLNLCDDCLSIILGYDDGNLDEAIN
jgi:hypothetical protein